MYHQIKERDASKTKTLRIVAVFVAVCVALVVWLGCTAADETTEEQGAEALRVSILKAAQQCCAVEGSYPSSLKHLEDSYGLRVNYDDYIVNYEVLGANVMPTVAVVPK